MLVHPKMVLLDLVGPLTVFNLMRCQIHLCWKNRDLLQTDVPVGISANTTFGECPSDLDVLFVPGGLEGSVMMMDDPEVIEFLQDRARTARYVTSVCTGGLVLGAAGLLKGYRATSHWYVRDLLSMMGAVPVHERVVQDRNRITAGGVTAGIDFGLAISIAMRGLEATKHTQLALEYDPHPPLDAGSPEKAGPGPTAHILQVRGPAIEAARQKAVAIGARL
jgi:cyclohexyl-isocyanide hydratase